MEIMTDERLDYLAERYLIHSIRHFTGIPFYKYLCHPDEFDRLAESMRKGRVLTVKVGADEGLVAHTMN